MVYISNINWPVSQTMKERDGKKIIKSIHMFTFFIPHHHHHHNMHHSYEYIFYLLSIIGPFLFGTTKYIYNNYKKKYCNEVSKIYTEMIDGLFGFDLRFSFPSFCACSLNDRTDGRERERVRKKSCGFHNLRESTKHTYTHSLLTGTRRIERNNQFFNQTALILLYSLGIIFFSFLLPAFLPLRLAL